MSKTGKNPARVGAGRAGGFFSSLYDNVLHSEILWPLAKCLIKNLRLFSYSLRARMGLLSKKPEYARCVFAGAFLGKSLGLKRISVIEFGVAGGRGLTALERHAEKIGREMGIEIEVYGFDSGHGLPKSVDYRDLPYIWSEGFYKMDYEKLRKRLHGAKIILGDVKETVNDFFKTYKPAPVAAVMFDMDLYSSTAPALRLFEADYEHLLPRIFTYFDDIGSSIFDYNACFSEYSGERLAINEFNAAHSDRKISPDFGLLAEKFRESWYTRIFIVHIFNHTKYNELIVDKEIDHSAQLSLPG
ncbi:MAG: hypothetical protein LBP37_04905 [Spirochaetaceae bacterium]|jgi:hypothetical protein|nr:hypothetical protein [Spirochaetaceae bacterium]